MPNTLLRWSDKVQGPNVRVTKTAPSGIHFFLSLQDFVHQEGGLQNWLPVRWVSLGHHFSRVQSHLDGRCRARGWQLSAMTSIPRFPKRRHSQACSAWGSAGCSSKNIVPFFSFLSSASVLVESLSLRDMSATRDKKICLHIRTSSS